MIRAGLQSGIVHLLDLGMVLKELGDGQGVPALRLEPDLQRADASEGEERLEGPMMEPAVF